MPAGSYIPVVIVLGHRSCSDRARLVCLCVVLMPVEMSECWMNIASDCAISDWSLRQF